MTRVDAAPTRARSAHAASHLSAGAGMYTSPGRAPRHQPSGFSASGQACATPAERLMPCTEVQRLPRREWGIARMASRWRARMIGKWPETLTGEPGAGGRCSPALAPPDAARRAAGTSRQAMTSSTSRGRCSTRTASPTGMDARQPAADRGGPEAAGPCAATGRAPPTRRARALRSRTRHDPQPAKWAASTCRNAWAPPFQPEHPSAKIPASTRPSHRTGRVGQPPRVWIASVDDPAGRTRAASAGV